MQRVFVSYSHENTTFAERLARDLQDAGFDVWIDFQSIRGGEAWRQKIFEGVKSSDFLLVCLSPDAAESTWVRDEVLMARAQDKRVIPVMHLIQTERDGQILKTLDLMAADEQLKALLEIHYVDFERHGYERAFKLLLDALPGVIRPASAAVQTQYGEVTLTDDPSKRQNPFKGLDAFQQTDAHVFFGREALTQKLVDKLKRGNGDASRFLAVVGASGSGKSSVVRAGLIPQIREAALPGSADWSLVIFTPGHQPTDALALRLLPLLGAGQLLPNVVAALESGEKALHQLTEQILADAPSSARLVLVIDQFEEVFTRASQNAAAQFLNLLHTAVTIPNGRTLVVLTMRADFFDRLSAYPDIAALFEQDNLVIATEMTADELRRGIEEPARVVGLVYDHGLPDRILEDVREQPGSLPLLQYALTALYLRRDEQRLTLAAYNEIDGVLGALAHHAESIYQSLAPSTEKNTSIEGDTRIRREREAGEGDQALMRRLLLRLVEVSETGEATRRRVRREDLTFRHVPMEAVANIIDRLTAPDSRLLVANREITGDAQAEPSVWLEVSHEALIREWDRFREWVADDLEALRLGGDLLKAAGDWERNGRDHSYLLTGSRLERAGDWLTDADSSDLQRQYVNASAQADAERRARDEQTARRVQNLQRLRTGAFIALIVAAFVAAYAIIQAANAVSERQAAETAQAAAVTEQQAALGTLAQVPATLQAADAQVVAAQETLVEAQGTLTQIPPILDAIATDSQVQLNNLDSLRLAAEARTANERDEPFLALALALEAVKIPGAPLSVEKTLADLAYSIGVKKQLRGHLGDVLSVAFSPDGKLALSGSSDRTVIVWDVLTGEALRTLQGHLEALTSVTFSPDGKLALSGSYDLTVIVWDVLTGEALRTLQGHSGAVNSVAFSPDGKLTLSGSDDSTVIVWNVLTGEALQTLQGHSGAVNSVAFSPDGKLVLSGSDDSTLRVWNIATGETLRTLRGHSAGVSNVTFSPDGKLALSGSYDRSVIVWDVASGVILRTLRGHTGAVYSVAFSPDGQLALSGSGDSAVIVWDVASGKALRTLRGHSDQVLGVAFSPDGLLALSGSFDNSLIVWDVATREVLRTLQGHSNSVFSVGFSSDGKLALSGSSDEAVTVWDMASGEALRTLHGHLNSVWSMAFSPNGQRMLSGLQEGTVIVRDMASGIALHTLRGHSGPVSSVAFSPDGKFALSGAYDGDVIVWDAVSGIALHTLRGHSGWINSVAFSPNGKLALSGSEDGTVRVWDVANGETLRTLEGLTGAVYSVAFSPDGKLALSGSEDGTMTVWDLASGEMLRTLHGHTGAVYSVAFSPDGQLALSGSLDGDVIAWNMASGVILRTLRGHTGAVYSVAFSPDGQHMLSGSDDGDVHVWHIDDRDELSAWVEAERYVLPLTCVDHAMYQIQRPCAEPVTTVTLDFIQVALTPSATLTPTAIYTPTAFDWTPLPITLPAWTPIDTPTPSNTLTPTLTLMPTLTPESAGEAQIGENHGEITVGGGQVWTYQGVIGERLTISVIADHPGSGISPWLWVEQGRFDSWLFVYQPDGTLFAKNDDINSVMLEVGSVTDTNSRLSDLILPVDGAYTFEIRSAYGGVTAGAYTLIVESSRAADVTLTPTP